MAVESSQIPEKTVEQIFDERYPLDKWKDSNYSILDKFSMRGRKGFVTFSPCVFIAFKSIFRNISAVETLICSSPDIS